MITYMIEADRWYVNRDGARVYVRTLLTNGRVEVEYLNGNTIVNVGLKALAEELIGRCATPEPKADI